MDETILGAIIGVGGAVIGAGITAGIQVLFNKEAERKRILHFLIETKADVNALMIKLFNEYAQASNANVNLFARRRMYYLKTQDKTINEKDLDEDYQQMQTIAVMYNESVNKMLEVKTDLIGSLSKIFSYSADDVKAKVDALMQYLELIDYNCYERTFDNMDINRCREYLQEETPEKITARLVRSVKQGVIDKIDSLLTGAVMKYIKAKEKSLR